LRNLFKKREKEQVTPSESPLPAVSPRVPTPQPAQPAQHAEVLVAEEVPKPGDPPPESVPSAADDPDVSAIGLGVIERLAKSARARGPIATSYAGVIALIAASLALLAVDMLDETEFLGVLAFSTVVLLAANALAFFQFRAFAVRATMITQSKIDADKEERIARIKRLDQATDDS